MNRKHNDDRTPRRVVALSHELHTALKAKARKEGRVLQAMVEDKLQELLAPQQLERVGGDNR